jgi:ribosomal protein S18 acetylase RimI-like enzyme
VRTALGDAWQVLGVAGVAELAGVRLMATGLPHAQWNNGDVHDAAAVDIGAVRLWYDDHRVPWGMRVPTGAPWPHGRLLFTQRLMGLTPAMFVPAVTCVGVRIRVATPADLETVLSIDTVAFGTSAVVERPWIELLLTHSAVTVALAEHDGVPVAIGAVTCTEGQAGPAGYVAAIGVLPDARRRGIGAAISSWLTARAFHRGAALCHLHPDTEHAAAIYRRLGFVEVDGVDIYVDPAQATPPS